LSTDSEHLDVEHREDFFSHTPVMSVLSNASIPSTECSVSEPSTTAIFMSPKILKKKLEKMPHQLLTPFSEKFPKKSNLLQIILN